MKKARSLREALIKAVPQLETNPEMMRIFADEGNIDARLAASLSHEKIYTLNVIVCDFVGDPDLIFVPVAAWLRENQPDICTLDDGRKKGLPFPDGFKRRGQCRYQHQPAAHRAYHYQGGKRRAACELCP